MTQRTIADLFIPDPPHWGLRGDPYLWREMRDHFAAIPLPETFPMLVEKIDAAFLQLTGSPISAPESFFVERFAHGGMSSGHVCPEFWREIAVPLLGERYERSHTS